MVLSFPSFFFYPSQEKAIFSSGKLLSQLYDAEIIWKVMKAHTHTHKHNACITADWVVVGFFLSVLTTQAHTNCCNTPTLPLPSAYGGPLLSTFSSFLCILLTQHIFLVLFVLRNGNVYAWFFRVKLSRSFSFFTAKIMLIIIIFLIA